MVTGVILAGGKSRRMKQNKSLMRLGDDILIGHVIRRIRTIADELLLITNNPDDYTQLDISMFNDIIPNVGALGGIHAGLSYASYETVICVGCDNPFLSQKLLNYLISILGEYDAVMPFTYKDSLSKKDDISNITLQTLCAVYSKRCLPIIDQMLNDQELRVHALQERANVHCLSPKVWIQYDHQGYSFFNVNTPEDFEKAQIIYKSLHDSR